MGDNIFNLSKSKGHLANVCHKGGDGATTSASGGSGSGGSAKPLVLATRPKLSFSKGTKIENAEEGAERMGAEKMLPNAVVDGSSEDVEWLGDFGASRHVRDGMSLL